MKFGVRQICNVVFKAKTAQKIGNMTFAAGQPVLYIDTATTSTLEGEATTVYAQGGRGNAKLIAWEGEKGLTFSVTDALLSPIGFAILSGAGLIHKDGDGTNNHSDDKHAMQHVHMTATQLVGTNGEINLADAMGATEVIAPDAPVFAVVTEADGSITGDLVTGLKIDGQKLTGATAFANKTVFVDFYVDKKTSNIYELQIDAANFAGYYYVEADTLFRDQATGKDMPANLTLPNVKIQSNFTFEMSATGDPSTFEFKMDAMPGYTMFDKTKKVMCVIQIINETIDEKQDNHTLMPNNGQTYDNKVTSFDVDANGKGKPYSDSVTGVVTTTSGTGTGDATTDPDATNDNAEQGTGG